MTPIWFAPSEDRPLFAFASLWAPWRGVQGPKSAPIDDHELFGFLTTEANAVVAPIHAKAMPVILTTQQPLDQGASSRIIRSRLTPRCRPVSSRTRCARDMIRQDRSRERALRRERWKARRNCNSSCRRERAWPRGDPRICRASRTDTLVHLDAQVA